VLDDEKKTLQVDLLPPNKGFLTEYNLIEESNINNSNSGNSNNNIRPVGIPSVFYPLDTCGQILHRRGITLENRDKTKPKKDFIISIFTKSNEEKIDKGLVLKLYDQQTSKTSVLHVGSVELKRLCDEADEPDLLRDILYSKKEEENVKEFDEIDINLKEFTVLTEIEKKTKKMIDYVMDIVLKDLGFFFNPMDDVIMYFKSYHRGILPS
jgi:hypothetical protein